MKKYNDLKLPIFLGLVLSILLIPQIALPMLLVSGFILFSPLILIFLIFLFIFFKGNRKFVFKKRTHPGHNFSENQRNSSDADSFSPKTKTSKNDKRGHSTITLSEEDYKIINKKQPNE